ncbi:uncharacterized protein LOC118763021 [Octopus sinensis]|uniref:Uncharacterized protein LOC118763021 n=1 Tax=Octopus sinensis TaxID=2607531 RepID=A0A7E6EQZ0_9MOLL|nr:uncharacterized protein LOC118763021 [Octopus sinensis]
MPHVLLWMRDVIVPVASVVVLVAVAATVATDGVGIVGGGVGAGHILVPVHVACGIVVVAVNVATVVAVATTGVAVVADGVRGAGGDSSAITTAGSATVAIIASNGTGSIASATTIIVANRPPIVFKNLVKGIGKRILSHSPSQETFATAAPHYNEALAASEFKDHIPYMLEPNSHRGKRQFCH